MKKVLIWGRYGNYGPDYPRNRVIESVLRSLGCEGGLTFQEFTSLSDKERRRRAAEHPRWCKVEYQGNVGWVAGSYLAEDACPPSPMPGSSR